jgi:putative transposase
MKPNTYTQLIIQLVFAVKHRECLLNKLYQTEVWKYLAGTINGLGHKSLIVNGTSDHVHALFGLNPVMSISDLARDIKRSSAMFIDDKQWYGKVFSWQDG